jgi:hypothetical protein
MSDRSLRELEGDVERARARLLAHLSVLSSPVSYSEFKEDLKEEARDTFHGIVENVKGRAAANPVATLGHRRRRGLTASPASPNLHCPDWSWPPQFMENRSCPSKRAKSRLSLDSEDAIAGASRRVRNHPWVSKPPIWPKK